MFGLVSTTVPMIIGYFYVLLSNDARENVGLMDGFAIMLALISSKLFDLCLLPMLVYDAVRGALVEENHLIVQMQRPKEFLLSNPKLYTPPKEVQNLVELFCTRVDQQEVS